MGQKLRALVELEIPDGVDLDALKEKLGESFPGMRFPEDDDMVIFFRPEVDGKDIEWGIVPPPEVTMYHSKTGGQMLHPMEAADLYGYSLGEALKVKEALIIREQQG